MYKPLGNDADNGDGTMNAHIDRDRMGRCMEMVDMAVVDVNEAIVDSKDVSTNDDIDHDTTLQSKDLFGLEESSSSLAKLIILNRQSTPVIVSFFLSLGGNFINLLFAGRFINSDNRSQVFAGIE